MHRRKFLSSSAATTLLFSSYKADSLAGRTIYLAEELSVAGDGLTNDLAALSRLFARAAIDCCNIVGKPRAIYRIVVNAQVTNRGLLLQNARLYLNGSSFHFECDGECYGMRLGSNSCIEGEGIIRTTISTNLPIFASSTWHAPISAGYAYLDPEKGRINCLGPLSTIRNIKLDGFSVHTTRSNNSAMLGIVGDVADGMINNLEFLDSANATVPLAFDWSSHGGMTRANDDKYGDWDVFAMRRNFENGEFYSVHPHNFEISHLKIGRMTSPYHGDTGGFGIRLSGCRNIRINNIVCAEATYCGFFNTAGDMGWEFALEKEKVLSGRGISITDYRVELAHHRGAYIDFYADNIARARDKIGYIPLMDPVIGSDIEIDGFYTYGPTINRADKITASNSGAGLYTQYLDGGVFKRIYSQGHLQGVNLNQGSRRVIIEHAKVSYSQLDGIVIGGEDATAQECVVKNCVSYQNGNDIKNGSTSSGIAVNHSVGSLIENNITGRTGETRQFCGIRLSKRASLNNIIGNHCLGVSQGGQAIFIDSNSFSKNSNILRNNSAENDILLYGYNSPSVAQ